MRRSLLAAAIALTAALNATASALAFSRIDPNGGESDSREGIVAVPLPPLTPERPEAKMTPEPPAPSEGTDAGEVPISPEEEGRDPDALPPAGGDEQPAPDATMPAGAIGKPQALQEAPAPATTPRVLEPGAIAYGDDGLPKPVRDLRDRLMEVARSGDIEKLHPYLEKGGDGTVLTFGEPPKDPIEFLKSASGDGEGVEMLAILLEVLEAGHAHVDAGSDQEMYVWPYFTQVDLEKLTKPQLVQLFKIVTAGDYQSMLDFGAYNFYRVGISPEGKLQFFVAGD